MVLIICNHKTFQENPRLINFGEAKERMNPGCQLIYKTLLCMYIFYVTMVRVERTEEMRYNF